MKKNIFSTVLFLTLFSISNQILAQTLVSTDPSNRVAVFEIFTAINGSYCPDGHSIMQDIADFYGEDVLPIKIHATSLAEPINSNQPDLRSEVGDSLFDVFQFAGIPSALVNRISFEDDNSLEIGRAAWAEYADSIVNMPSPVNIGAATYFDPVTRELLVTVELFYTDDPEGINNFVHIALIENDVTGPQVDFELGMINNYEHNQVLRKLITGVSGDQISTGNNFVSRLYSYTVPEEFDIGNCEIVAYVSENMENVYTGTKVAANGSVLPWEFYEISVAPFYDGNANGLLDSDEYEINSEVFSLTPSSLFAFSDGNGLYNFLVEEGGTYELNWENQSSLWGTSSNLPIELILTGYQTDTLLPFPMYPVADFVVQDIDLSSSITRCNLETNYWLTYSNTGTVTTNGYVELIPDESTTFVSSSPLADSTADGKLYWFYEELYPTYSNQIYLVYEMPGVEALGETIDFEVNIETNEGFGDHKENLSSDLVCAYDPNDKLVTPFGYGNENYTLFDDTLEYTIRFQNTGNDTAFTVIIRDELSEYLNLNTFRPIASSHNVETQVDIESRLATFTFNDIYLPDSFVNEPGSHGFVKYQILGNENLAENTDVKNTASIFFDANPPIVTNTVSNRMVSVLPALPILTASEEALDFGEIALDELLYGSPQIFTIENIGDLDLIVENFAFGDAAFYVEIDNLTIAGQGSIEVPVYFAPNEAGSYQSDLTLESNVGNVSIALSGTAIEATGVNSVLPAQFVLFPNPTEGLFYLESEGAQIQSYHIYNSLGKLILEEKTSEVVERIDLSKQAKGLYFISVETDEGVFVEKIVVQ